MNVRSSGIVIYRPLLSTLLGVELGPRHPESIRWGRSHPPLLFTRSLDSREDPHDLPADRPASRPKIFHIAWCRQIHRKLDELAPSETTAAELVLNIPGPKPGSED